MRRLSDRQFRLLLDGVVLVFFFHGQHLNC